MSVDVIIARTRLMNREIGSGPTLRKRTVFRTKWPFREAVRKRAIVGCEYNMLLAASTINVGDITIGRSGLQNNVQPSETSSTW